MKNIHLIPTDKPSRLYSFYGMLEDLSYGKTFTIVNEEVAKINLHKNLKEYQEKLIKANWKSENIYITSNEEIKEGDYVYHTQMFNYIGFTGIAKVGKQRVNQEFEITSLDGQHTYYSCKEPKVVLTTDQELIKNGVQAIDDEFLEWFVKNSSCEWVEVNKGSYNLSLMEEMLEKEYVPKGTFDTYKIIFPKEESKQESLEEVIKIIFKEEIESDCTNIDKCITDAKIRGFKKGVKWQQEQSDNEILEFGRWIIQNSELENDSSWSLNTAEYYLKQFRKNKL